MALRDQPYLPLYIQDFMTDEKLAECSPLANGVYIRIMCIFHKSEDYGSILLKQKDKQNESNTINFAYKLVKQMPYNVNDVIAGITELIAEKVLIVEGDRMYQKRMVKDFKISEERSKAGKNGYAVKSFAKAKKEANHQANAENVNEDDSIGNKGLSNNTTGENPKIDGYRNIENLKPILLADNFYIGLISQNGVNISDIPKWLDAFNRRLTFVNDTIKQEQEYRRHFASWIVKVPNYRTMNPDDYNPIKEAEVKNEGYTSSEQELMKKYANK